MNDKKVPVRNFLLIKRLEDDQEIEGGVRLVGTLIQYVKHDVLTEVESMPKSLNDGDKPSKYFNIRLNDCTYKDGNTLEIRRTKDTGKVWRTTFQVRIPLKINVEEEMFPFKLLTAKANIELSSGSIGNQTIRPNLVLAHGENIRSNVVFKVEKEKSDGNIHKKVDEVLDCMTKYDLQTPYPEVSYEYNKKKGYCPSFSVTFHLKIDGAERFVRTLLPLFLVSTLNTLYWWNDWMEHEDKYDDKVYKSSIKEDVSDLLTFSSQLTLTIVFLFGSIYAPSTNKTKLSKLSDFLYIIFIFVSLILSAIPESFVGGCFGLRIAGVSLFWISFIFPISNYAIIWWRVHQKKPKNGIEKYFVKDEDYEEQEDFSEDIFVTLEPNSENERDLAKRDLAKKTKNRLNPDFEMKKKCSSILISYPREDFYTEKGEGAGTSNDNSSSTGDDISQEAKLVGIEQA